MEYSKFIIVAICDNKKVVNQYVSAPKRKLTVEDIERFKSMIRSNRKCKEVSLLGIYNID